VCWVCPEIVVRVKEFDAMRGAGSGCYTTPCGKRGY